MGKKSVTMIDSEKAASWAKKYTNLKPLQEPQALTIKMFFLRHYDAIKNLVDGGHGLRPVYNDLASEGLVGGDESNTIKTLRRIWTQVSNEIAAGGADKDQATQTKKPKAKKIPPSATTVKQDQSSAEKGGYNLPLSDKV